jgi:radical SAM enzyme (TIGR01210 family)
VSSQGGDSRHAPRYPAAPRDRDAWILAHRGPKAPLDASVAYASMWEEERDVAGSMLPTAAIFLTNKECPFRCLMCDLWVRTLDRPVGPGDIPQQIRNALSTLPPARQVKLYNAGNFFDPEAIPVSDDRAIADELRGFDRVIVESHPAFLRGAHGERCVRFRDAIDGRLEVAVGLETVHPDVLSRLNKRMTVESFARGAEFLARHDIALRAFVLLKPPFMTEDEGVSWACRSLDFAVKCGATACSVIPTRGGNGAMEAGDEPFVPPSLRSLERVVEYGMSLRGRVFADLWDVERLFGCECSPRRAARIARMNREQRIPESVSCLCGS